MANQNPNWEENEVFKAKQKPIVEPDKGPLVRSPICFKAWPDLHEALKNVPDKQKWLRDMAYEKAEREGLL